LRRLDYLECADAITTHSDSISDFADFDVPAMISKYHSQACRPAVCCLKLLDKVNLSMPTISLKQT
jgi:hypothetical protein